MTLWNLWDNYQKVRWKVQEIQRTFEMHLWNDKGSSKNGFVIWAKGGVEKAWKWERRKVAAKLIMQRKWCTSFIWELKKYFTHLYVLWQRWLTIIRDLCDSFLRMTTKLLLQMHMFDKMHEPIYHRLKSQTPSIPSQVSKSDCQPPLGQKKAH